MTERNPALEAAEWFAIACELDGENRQLRGWLTNFMIQIAARDELLEFGREEIERRFPSRGSCEGSPGTPPRGQLGVDHEVWPEGF